MRSGRKVMDTWGRMYAATRLGRIWTQQYLLLSREATTAQRVHLFLALPLSSENFLKRASLYFQLLFSNGRVVPNVSLECGRMRSES